MHFADASRHHPLHPFVGDRLLCRHPRRTARRTDRDAGATRDKQVGDEAVFNEMKGLDHVDPDLRARARGTLRRSRWLPPSGRTEAGSPDVGTFVAESRWNRSCTTAQMIAMTTDTATMPTTIDR